MFHFKSVLVITSLISLNFSGYVQSDCVAEITEMFDDSTMVKTPLDYFLFAFYFLELSSFKEDKIHAKGYFQNLLESSTIQCRALPSPSIFCSTQRLNFHCLAAIEKLGLTNPVALGKEVFKFFYENTDIDDIDAKPDVVPYYNEVEKFLLKATDENLKSPQDYCNGQAHASFGMDKNINDSNLQKLEIPIGLNCHDEIKFFFNNIIPLEENTRFLPAKLKLTKKNENSTDADDDDQVRLGELTAALEREMKTIMKDDSNTEMSPNSYELKLTLEQKTKIEYLMFAFDSLKLSSFGENNVYALGYFQNIYNSAKVPTKVIAGPSVFCITICTIEKSKKSAGLEQSTQMATDEWKECKKSMISAGLELETDGEHAFEHLYMNTVQSDMNKTYNSIYHTNVRKFVYLSNVGEMNTPDEYCEKLKKQDNMVNNGKSTLE